jgi:hypothetical protein
MENKRCSKCYLELPISCFYKRSASPDGLTPSCKGCYRELKKEADKRNRGREHIEIPLIRKCSACKVTLPSSEFNLNSSRGDGLEPCCKKCVSKKGMDWQKRHPTAAWEASLKREYGIDSGVFNLLWESQGNRCAVCKRERMVGEKRFHVDHDHITGKVRGILCFKCNSGIGLFRDNPVLLHRVIEYLKSGLLCNPGPIDRIGDVQNNKYFRRRLKLTNLEFEGIFKCQGGKCKICHEVLSNDKFKCYLDHDHSTGKVRGLLCGYCNFGIGAFQDSEVIVRSAIDYLSSNL